MINMGWLGPWGRQLTRSRTAIGTAPAHFCSAFLRWKERGSNYSKKDFQNSLTEGFIDSQKSFTICCVYSFLLDTAFYQTSDFGREKTVNLQLRFQCESGMNVIVCSFWKMTIPLRLRLSLFFCAILSAFHEVLENHLMQHSKFCPKVRVLHHRFGRDYEIERWQLRCWLPKNDLFFRSLLTLKPFEVCVVCFEQKNYSSKVCVSSCCFLWQSR